MCGTLRNPPLEVCLLPGEWDLSVHRRPNIGQCPAQRVRARGRSRDDAQRENDQALARGCTRPDAVASGDVVAGRGAAGRWRTEAARWKGLVKGWCQRDYYAPPLNDQRLSIPDLARIKAVVDDPGVTAIAEPVKHVVFPSIDRAVHRRSAWAASVSMSSARISFYETGNGENKRGSPPR